MVRDASRIAAKSSRLHLPRGPLLTTRGQSRARRAGALGGSQIESGNEASGDRYKHIGPARWI
jgi:hypothetical protein